MDSTRHATAPTRLGEITLVAEGDALSGLYFPQHWHPPTAQRLGAQVEASEDAVLRGALEQVTAYLCGAREAFDLALAPQPGEGFDTAVWGMLTSIPYGTTTTYGALAVRLGNPGLARRVGGAVGRNPLSIVVPCHRVVGQGGKLTGYAGGLERKRTLLELEGAPVAAAAAALF